MDRIDGSGNLPFRPDIPTQNKKSDKKKKSSGKVFTGVLGQLLGTRSGDKLSVGEIHNIESDEQLEEIVDSIQRYGRELSKFPGTDNLARYKQAVRNFVQHVVSHAYSAEEQISRKNILNQKKYTLIKVVDEKLESLSKSVLSSQSEQIDLLGQIEEIQGLLINILHVS